LRRDRREEDRQRRWVQTENPLQEMEVPPFLLTRRIVPAAERE
jgi:hypothetical protein